MSAQMRRLISIATVTLLLGQLGQAPAHTTHPDAQWFPDAALGLFLHRDPASVKDRTSAGR
jgi:hypothetical protein